MTTEATNTPQEDNVDLGALFNEITTGTADFSTEDSEDVGNSLGSVGEEAPQPETEDTPSDDVETPQSDEGLDQGDDKDSEPTVEPEATEDPQADIWAGASDEQREAFRNLQHESLKLQNDVKANAGRVQGYAKKLNEVQAQLDQFRNAQTQQPQTNAGTQNVQLDGKTLQEVEEEYPEIAQYVRSQTQQVVAEFRQELDPLKQQTSQNSGTLEELAQDRQQSAVRNELDRLSQAHPDYVDLRQSPEFHGWLNQKPDSIRSLANSMLADDNIELLNLFKAQRVAPQQSAPAQTQPAHAPQRKTDLSEHAEVPRKGAAPPQGLPEDPEELFNLITSQKKR